MRRCVTPSRSQGRRAERSWWQRPRRGVGGKERCGATLSAIASSIAAEWARFDVASLQYLASRHRAARADRTGRDRRARAAGADGDRPHARARHHLVVPAMLRPMAVVAPVVDAPRAGRAVRARPAVRGARGGRSLFVAGRGERDLSGPPHQPDDRRLRQHADVVQGRDPEHPQRSAAGLLHDGGGRGAVRRAAPQGQVSRPDGAGRVRQPRLRDHAVHERLRQPAAQHGADRRPGGVLDCSPSRAR